jgi:DNA-binding Lrp family transcriptional regulator
MTQRRLLEGLGVSGAEEGAYRALLRHGPATLNELAGETGGSAAAIRRMLPRLEDLGLISRLAGRPLRVIATPPNVAIDVLAARRQEEITHSRAAAAALVAESAGRGTGPGPEEVLEVVNGSDALARRYLQLERTAEHEILVLVHPPYAVDVSDDGENLLRAARHRAPTRGIYGPLAFEVPGMLEHTRRAVADGEQARLGQVPVKLAIADGRTAMLPLVSESGRAVESALVVHPSALLDALVGLFEVLWQAAVPLRLSEDGGIGGAPWLQQPDREVLALLTAGLKDEAIARQLGLSSRTVQRRVQAILERLGAGTRFQAGYLASRDDLLG